MVTDDRHYLWGPIHDSKRRTSEHTLERRSQQLHAWQCGVFAQITPQALVKVMRLSPSLPCALCEAYLKADEA